MRRLLWDTKLEIGCWLQEHLPYLWVTGTSKSKGTTIGIDVSGEVFIPVEAIDAISESTSSSWYSIDNSELALL